MPFFLVFFAVVPITRDLLVEPLMHCLVCHNVLHPEMPTRFHTSPVAVIYEHFQVCYIQLVWQKLQH